MLLSFPFWLKRSGLFSWRVISYHDSSDPFLLFFMERMTMRQLNLALSRTVYCFAWLCPFLEILLSHLMTQKIYFLMLFLFLYLSHPSPIKSKEIRHFKYLLPSSYPFLLAFLFLFFLLSKIICESCSLEVYALILSLTWRPFLSFCFEPILLTDDSDSPASNLLWFLLLVGLDGII